MVSFGGRNVVEREPEKAELELVLALTIDRIVRTEPMDDCISDQIRHCDRAIENLPVNIMS